MFRFEPLLLALLVASLAPTTAAAESMTASLEAGSERAPRDFSHAVLNYDIATLTEMYDSGLSWTAFAQNSRVAHDGPNVWALEAMLGYRYAFSRYLVYGSAGFGERLIKPHDIAYATFRFGMDATLSRSFTWNALNLRYRDGLDRDIAYRSSVAGTGVTWRATEDTALYTRVFAVFDSQDRFAGTGLGLGIRQFF